MLSQKQLLKLLFQQANQRTWVCGLHVDYVCYLLVIGMTPFINCTLGQFTTTEGQFIVLTQCTMCEVHLQYQLLYYLVQYCLSLVQPSSLALSGAVLLARLGTKEMFILTHTQYKPNRKQCLHLFKGIFLCKKM